MLEWLKFVLVALLFGGGLFCLFVSLFGTFRFDFALNRIHASAMCDTLVLLLFLAACAIVAGFDLMTLKFLLLAAIQWCTSPLVSHMLVKMEYMTDVHLPEHCALPEDDACKKEEV